jgi:UDP-glucose 4-epimerase
LDLIEVLETSSPVPVIFFSTGAVYGNDPDGKEEEAQIATSPYAASKAAGEAIVEAYCHKWQKSFHIIRPGCVVGSRYHHGHIADFVKQAKADGALRALSNGYGAKSFVHVADVVNAVLMMLFPSRIPSGVYNVASKTLWRPRDTVEVMRALDIDNAALKVSWAEDPYGWTGDSLATLNTAKLAAFGWQATHRIERGVEEALTGLGWP